MCHAVPDENERVRASGPGVVAVSLILVIGCVGCEASATTEEAPAIMDAGLQSERQESCGRAQLPDSVMGLEPRWHVMRPPHSRGESGVERQVDAVFQTCAGLFSFAHDPGMDTRTLSDLGPTHVLFSPDGLSWRESTMENAVYNDVAFGDGRFVAVGRGIEDATGTIAVSDDRDAATWREVFTFDGSPSGVAFGAGVFVAVLNFNLVFSEDGEHWQSSQLPPHQALFFDVAFGNGRFVVAGVGATLSSSDGRNWEEAVCGDPACESIAVPSGPPAMYLALQEVDYAGGIFRASGASGRLQSTDGRAFLPVSGRVPNVDAGALLLSLGASVGLSEDGGRSWTDYPLSSETSTADCVHNACVPAGYGFLVMELDSTTR